MRDRERQCVQRVEPESPGPGGAVEPGLARAEQQADGQEDHGRDDRAADRDDLTDGARTGDREVAAVREEERRHAAHDEHEGAGHEADRLHRRGVGERPAQHLEEGRGLTEGRTALAAWGRRVRLQHRAPVGAHDRSTAFMERRNQHPEARGSPEAAEPRRTVHRKRAAAVDSTVTGTETGSSALAIGGCHVAVSRTSADRPSGVRASSSRRSLSPAVSAAPR